MKFDLLIEIIRQIFFSNNHTENKTGRIFLDLFLYFRKALYKAKASGMQLGFTMFPQPSDEDAIKENFYNFNIIDPKIYSILIFPKRFWE